jgi:putative transposase
VVLAERFGVSERRACRVVGQHRSTQRLDPPGVAEDEQQLRAWLRTFSKQRPRWGWRRAAKQARQEGWIVNDKRIQRLWRDEGPKVPYRKRKKPHRGIGTAVGPMCPIAPNALWAMDFDTTGEHDTTTRSMETPAGRVEAPVACRLHRVVGDHSAVISVTTARAEDSSTMAFFAA